MMRYRISLRLCADDASHLEAMRGQMPHRAELLRKGQPVRPKSEFLAEQNVLVVYSVSAERIDETAIISEIAALPPAGPDIKKELIISTVSESDQYGFKLSRHFVQFLGSSGFSIQISGVFL